MKPITIALLLFTILELLNVMILYFKPDSKKGNGIGFFKAYEKSKEIPEVHMLVKYLTNWVAGTKLIFIALIIVIVTKTEESIQLISAITLTLAILTFYWRLYPLIRKIDKNGDLAPKGYSITLGRMIFGFILVFIVAITLSYIK